MSNGVISDVQCVRGMALPSPRQKPLKKLNIVGRGASTRNARVPTLLKNKTNK